MSDWQSALQSESNQWSSSPDADTLLCTLGEQSLLSVKGPDAIKFLQGQVTCDIAALTDSDSTLGAHCTHQGRMVSAFRAFLGKQEEVLLSLPSDIRETAQAALAKYIVFSKADLSSQDSKYGCLGLIGPSARATLEELFGDAPENVNEVFAFSDGWLVCVAPEQYECWIDSTQIAKHWQALAAHCLPGDTNDWQLAAIRAGIPAIHESTQDAFIPQMLNLELIDGVSFTKGCYTGQEVVARMEYRGKVKRRMYRVSFPLSPGETLPASGQLIYADSGEQSIGSIVVAAQANATESKVSGEALAVLTTKVADANNAYLDTDRLKKMDILSLPYSISDAGDQ